MQKISVFDTTISDYNLGNQIIMESVYKHLNQIFPEDFFFKVPYMEITNHTIQYLNRSDLKFFGGTNSLSGQMESYNQWDLSLTKSFRISEVILMGIGWWQYENKISFYTKFVLNKVLSKNYFHSVRDSHTKEKLSKVGSFKILNTGCPTLWDLTPEHCAKIPTNKKDSVVTTFTDYNKNPERDKQLLKALLANYKSINCWIQGEGDLEYVNEISRPGEVNFISPNLKSFDDALRNPETDYVGTRLHAGIRALQMGRRALIIGIDNRAIEMSKDFNLPVLNQKDIKELDSWINSSKESLINLPLETIATWKNQFKK